MASAGVVRRRNQGPQKVVDNSRIVVGIEDMVLIPDARDTAIAENLRVRLVASEMYTYIGPVLIACNPYKWLNIYNEAWVKKYILQQRTDVPPHIFSTAEAAYRGMLTEEESQCIIVSGESGAGKTEASKQIQNYIASVSGGGEGVDKIKEVFLRSNPVLEAFGNAKTLRNNNSSRFGKYFELKFNRFGSPMGGIITNYLLEKSRIVKPGPGERGFHIFYQLLASQQHARQFSLQGPTNYNYLSCSQCATVDGVNDSTEFEETLNAMKSVGLTSTQITSILNAVAAVLHLGNVQFTPQRVENAEGSAIARGDALNKFCELMKLDANEVTQILTFRELTTMAAGGKTDTYQVPQSPAQAATRRDALAKSIYERLFDLIVSRINVALDPERLASNNATLNADGDDVEDLLSIGVLDIYGFEVFDNNGFEQLCINYVNEKLQQIFIELTLRAEQDEYEREGIAWTAIPFFNNKIVCELLDGPPRPASGVFRILDDTCRTMHGTSDNSEVDRKFLETCGQVHGSHKHYQGTTKGFTIKHYAGDVFYTMGKFGDANKDALNKDLILLMKSTRDKLIAHLFGEEVDVDDRKQAPTAGNRIRTQCAALVTALMECSPHYIRCIKSNDAKQALTMDKKRVEHQVKYLGLSENVKVRRAGFAYRTEYGRFLDRFAIMCPSTYPDWKGTDKDGCREIVKTLAQVLEPGVITKEEVQLGKSMIFVRKPETYFLIEKAREKCIGDYVIRIQRKFRKYVSSKEFVSMAQAMGKTFSERNKHRRRDSIFRPYQGEYLGSLGQQVAEVIRDAIFKVIDFYDKSENIVFADASSYVCVCPNAMVGRPGYPPAGAPPPTFGQLHRIVVLTTGALYLFEAPVDAAARAALTPTKALPDVLLRRRIALKANNNSNNNNNTSNNVCVCTAILDAVSVSLLADNVIVIHVKPVERMAKPDESHYVENAKADKCMQTGQPFGMFLWRHHCRVSGQVFCDAVSDFLEPVPDRGFYTPSRVNDQFIGFSSTEQAEDVVLICDRKTELLGLLMQHTKAASGRSNATLTVNFTNTVRVRGGPDVALTHIPAQEIVFVQGPPTPRAKGRNGNGRNNNNTSRAPAPTPNIPNNPHANVVRLDVVSFNAEFRGEVSGTRLTISTEPGLTQDVVEERRKRAIQRAKRAEARRRQAEAERKERNAAREKERERERIIRLQEKKARKKAEKEAKRRAREIANGAGGGDGGGGLAAPKAKKPISPAAGAGAGAGSSARFTPPIPGGGKASAAAAIASARSGSAPLPPPPPPPPPSRSNDTSDVDDSSSRPRNSALGNKSQSFSAGAPAIPTGGAGGLKKTAPKPAVGAAGPGGGNAASELAAAMARRRAANNET